MEKPLRIDDMMAQCKPKPTMTKRSSAKISELRGVSCMEDLAKNIGIFKGKKGSQQEDEMSKSYRHQEPVVVPKVTLKKSVSMPVDDTSFMQANTAFLQAKRAAQSSAFDGDLLSGVLDKISTEKSGTATEDGMSVSERLRRKNGTMKKAVRRVRSTGDHLKEDKKKKKKSYKKDVSNDIDIDEDSDASGGKPETVEDEAVSHPPTNMNDSLDLNERLSLTVGDMKQAVIRSKSMDEIDEEDYNDYEAEETTEDKETKEIEEMEASVSHPATEGIADGLDLSDRLHEKVKEMKARQICGTDGDEKVDTTKGKHNRAPKTSRRCKSMGEAEHPSEGASKKRHQKKIGRRCTSMSEAEGDNAEPTVLPALEKIKEKSEEESKAEECKDSDGKKDGLSKTSHGKDDKRRRGPPGRSRSMQPRGRRGTGSDAAPRGRCSSPPRGRVSSPHILSSRSPSVQRRATSRDPGPKGSHLVSCPVLPPMPQDDEAEAGVGGVSPREAPERGRRGVGRSRSMNPPKRGGRALDGDTSHSRASGGGRRNPGASRNGMQASSQAALAAIAAADQMSGLADENDHDNNERPSLAANPRDKKKAMRRTRSVDETKAEKLEPPKHEQTLDDVMERPTRAKRGASDTVSVVSAATTSPADAATLARRANRRRGPRRTRSLNPGPRPCKSASLSPSDNKDDLDESAASQTPTKEEAASVAQEETPSSSAAPGARCYTPPEQSERQVGRASNPLSTRTQSGRLNIMELRMHVENEALSKIAARKSDVEEEVRWDDPASVLNHGIASAEKAADAVGESAEEMAAAAAKSAQKMTNAVAKSALMVTKVAAKSAGKISNAAAKTAVEATNVAGKTAVKATNVAAKSGMKMTKVAANTAVDVSLFAADAAGKATYDAGKSAVKATNVAAKSATKSLTKVGKTTLESMPSYLDPTRLPMPKMKSDVESSKHRRCLSDDSISKEKTRSGKRMEGESDPTKSPKKTKSKSPSQPKKEKTSSGKTLMDLEDDSNVFDVTSEFLQA